MKTIFKKRAIMLFAIVCVGGILMSSCSKKDDTPIVYGNSYVRVFNAVSTSSPQDFYQSDAKISTSAVAYGEASTGYYTVKGGPSVLQFKDATTSTLTASANIGMQEGGYFTVFNYKDKDGIIRVGGVADNRTAPATGKIRVRFLNIAYSANNSINVTNNSNSALVASNLGIGDSDYIEIDPVSLGVLVIGSTTTTVIPAASFTAGKIYTIWFDSATSTSVNAHVLLQN